MIVSFLLQAADTVVKVIIVFSSSLRFPQLPSNFFVWFTLRFPYFAGANLFGCKQKT